MTDLSERDEMTLRVLAIIERTNLAEQRRRALADRAAQAREDPRVAEIVRLMLAARREQRDGGENVINMEGHRQCPSHS